MTRLSEQEIKKYRKIRSYELVAYLTSKGIKYFDFRFGRNGIYYLYPIDWRLEMEIDRFWTDRKHKLHS